MNPITHCVWRKSTVVCPRGVGAPHSHVPDCQALPRPLLCGHEPWPSGGLASLGLTTSAAEPDPMGEWELTVRAQKRCVEVAGKTLRVTWSLSLSGGKRDEVLLGTGSLAVTMRASSLGWHRCSMSQNQTLSTPGRPWSPLRPPSSRQGDLSPAAPACWRRAFCHCRSFHPHRQATQTDRAQRARPSGKNRDLPRREAQGGRELKQNRMWRTDPGLAENLRKHTSGSSREMLARW